MKSGRRCDRDKIRPFLLQKPFVLCVGLNAIGVFLQPLKDCFVLVRDGNQPAAGKNVERGCVQQAKLAHADDRSS